MSEYRPPQHKGRPQGCSHDVISANVQLWEDEPPKTIILGSLRYVLSETETDND